VRPASRSRAASAIAGPDRLTVCTGRLSRRHVLPRLRCVVLYCPCRCRLPRASGGGEITCTTGMPGRVCAEVMGTVLLVQRGCGCRCSEVMYACAVRIMLCRCWRVAVPGTHSALTVRCPGPSSAAVEICLLVRAAQSDGQRTVLYRNPPGTPSCPSAVLSHRRPAEHHQSRPMARARRSLRRLGAPHAHVWEQRTSRGGEAEKRLGRFCCWAESPVPRSLTLTRAGGVVVRRAR
jgi:hypothetical protein